MNTKTTSFLKSKNTHYKINSKGKIEVLGDLNLDGVKDADFNQIVSVEGGVSLASAKDVDLSKLKSIGGTAFLAEAKGVDLSELKSIVGTAILLVAKDINLSGLKSIGCHAYLSGTKNIDLSGLESIGENADLEGAENVNLSKLESIGGNAHLADANIELIKLIDPKRKILTFDGISIYVNNTRQEGDFTIHDSEYIGADNLEDKRIFIAVRGSYSAHGETVRKAIEDCNFKFLQAAEEQSEWVKAIKENGFVTLQQYRFLTGACEAGCKAFWAARNITADKLLLEEVKEVIRKQYGSEAFFELFE